MRPFEIGVVSDEISRDLRESLGYCREWGLSKIELREGSQARFPKFTKEEFGLIEEARGEGFQVTAVSPGIFKAHVDSTADIRNELEKVLPESIEIALRFECPMVISFGFERYSGEPQSNRTLVMKTLEQAANLAWDNGLVLAVENEPDFWIDEAAEEAEMFEEISHPGLKANWDPANSHWGGTLPTRKGFEALRPHIVNLHVKDFTPDDPDVPPLVDSTVRAHKRNAPSETRRRQDAVNRILVELARQSRGGGCGGRVERQQPHLWPGQRLVDPVAHVEA